VPNCFSHPPSTLSPIHSSSSDSPHARTHARGARTHFMFPHISFRSPARYAPEPVLRAFRGGRWREIGTEPQPSVIRAHEPFVCTLDKWRCSATSSATRCRSNPVNNFAIRLNETRFHSTRLFRRSVPEGGQKTLSALGVPNSSQCRNHYLNSATYF